MIYAISNFIFVYSFTNYLFHLSLIFLFPVIFVFPSSWPNFLKVLYV